MEMIMRRMLVIALVLFAVSPCHAGDDWTSLFNGKDLSGWDTWLGRPIGTDYGLNLVRDYVKVSKLPQEQQQELVGQLAALSKSLTDPVGLNRDPLNVYTVVQADKQPAIRISGAIFGAITSQQEYENYHLKLEFKWGKKRWPPREDAVRDSGLLYHCVGPHGAAGTFWMKSQELQIQEKDCGDYWSVAGAVVDVEAESKGGLVYKKGAPKVTVPGKGTGARIIKSPDNEKPTGQWNTIELLAVGGTSVHVVNSKVVMVLTNSRHLVEGKETPLTRGKIQIQSEGAEVFYRNIAVRPLSVIPAKYLQ
jgi:hypothetical protein